jgi:hypothetical protein
VVTVAAALCGHALSWRKRTPLDRSPWQLWIVGFRFSSSMVLYLTLLTVSPFSCQCSRIGPFLSQNNVSISFLASTDVDLPEIFLPNVTLSFHLYSFYHNAESLFSESHSVSLLTTKILLQKADPLWCNFLAGRPWFSRLFDCACPAISCTLSETAL